MRLRLDTHLVVEFGCDQPAVEAKWKQIFAGCPQVEAADPHLQLQLAVEETLPAPPTAAPLFVDDRPEHQGTLGQLAVFTADRGMLLRFRGAASIHIYPEEGRAVGVMTPTLWRSGRFEDITLTTLAPLLRRRGYYLLHAFAAAPPQKASASLIVGASGSGKTTTGLNLLHHGWRLLANDTVLLQERDGRIYALPTPGFVTVRPPTFALLPNLAARLGQTALPTADIAITADDLIDSQWSPPLPVHHIYFPQISEGEVASMERPLMGAIALARLLEESIDRWDEAAVDDHTELLQMLVTQASTHMLSLGRDIDRIPSLFSKGA